MINGSEHQEDQEITNVYTGRTKQGKREKQTNPQLKLEKILSTTLEQLDRKQVGTCKNSTITTDQMTSRTGAERHTNNTRVRFLSKHHGCHPHPGSC